jgi:hypothetical protein
MLRPLPIGSEPHSYGSSFAFSSVLLFNMNGMPSKTIEIAKAKHKKTRTGKYDASE